MKILNPNSSGQGECPDRIKHPFDLIAMANGYTYSHSVYVTQMDGKTKHLWHCYKYYKGEKNEHNLSFFEFETTQTIHALAWKTSVSCASGRNTTGYGEESLTKHLLYKRQRYNLTVFRQYNGMTYAQLASIFTGGFDVTGELVNGGKFKHHYTMIGMAMAINLWRGSVWGVLPNGTRKLLKRVYN